MLGAWPRFAVEDVHRFGGMLVGTFITIHVVAIAIDAWLPFSITSIVIPFTARYKPLWVGLGIVAAELLLALAITNRLRNRRISHRFWRRAHYLNFGVWGAATLHSLGSGTDRSTPWLISVEAAAIAVVCGAIAWRALAAHVPSARLRGVVVGCSIAAPAFAVVAVLGPLRFQPKPWNAHAFKDSLVGQVQQQAGVTRGIVSFVGRGEGDQPVLVRADLLLTSNALLSTSFQMEYLPSGLMCTGAVTRTHAYGFAARCRVHDGTRRLVSASWTAQPGNPQVNGRLNVTGSPT